MKKVIHSQHLGFTIVELLVVIVVIGILAAITIVSYTGIAQRAIVASLQSDLSSASNQLKIAQIIDTSGNYPTQDQCPTPDVGNICLKASGGNTFTYTSYNGSNPKTFTLDVTNINGTRYRITNDTTPIAVGSSLADIDPANWLTIGTQVWAKANLNVGTLVTGVTVQTDNALLEKYCYDDLESNCTTYGGLYLWNEAMQYVLTEGAQGICPASSHVPSDNEWKILEVYLGMTQMQADATNWRGTDQGTKLKSGGSSGLNMPIGGYRTTGMLFSFMSSITALWSSSESSTTAWSRQLSSSDVTVRRNAYSKNNGYSVRCIGD